MVRITGASCPICLRVETDVFHGSLLYLALPLHSISARGLVLLAERNFQEQKHMPTALPALIQVHFF